MANSSSTEKPNKTSFFRGVKQEFKKITWPSLNDAFKQTVVVTVISVIVGLIIWGVDAALQYGFDLWTGISI